MYFIKNSPKFVLLGPSREKEGKETSSRLIKPSTSLGDVFFILPSCSELLPEKLFFHQTVERTPSSLLGYCSRKLVLLSFCIGTGRYEFTHARQKVLSLPMSYVPNPKCLLFSFVCSENKQCLTNQRNWITLRVNYQCAYVCYFTKLSLQITLIFSSES